MGPTGRLVTIKRSGADGPHFPLSLSTCLFGRGIECDIRIQLPVVSKQHCKIEINGREAMLFNFSSTNPTQVNGSTIDGPVQLKHGDVITVVDRSFRYENESHEDRRKSTEFPGQRRKQESLRRVSRSSLSSDPDGKLQDSDVRSRASEDSVSGRPLKNVQAAGMVSGGCEDWVASRTPNVVLPSELAGGNSRNTTDPTGRDSKEDFSITLVSCKGDLKPLPSTQGLENGANNESPFKKLYESMKEELDVKSEKGDVLQSGKKSGTRSHHPPEKECSGDLQGGTQVPGSLKSRPRSGRGTQMKADPALGEQGISQTEDRRQGEEAVETSKETRGPIVPPEEMTETKTLAQRSPQASRKRQHEDMMVAGGSAPVNLDQKEGFRTDNKTFTPRKSLARNQTPAKVENADNFGDTPENLFSKRRRSIPTSVDVLTPEPETQNHAILAPLPVQVERKIPNSSVHQPEKAGAAVGRMHSGLPGRSSVDTSNFGDSINKTEGTPLKRRRVSFGGRLKPELFDENLPPNTPLKRGETPRRSLVSHTPPVLKKIIKVGSTDRPQPSGKEDSSGLHLEGTAQPQFAGSPARDPTRTSPGARDPRRRSPKASSVSGGSKSHHTDVPKRGGRKSGGLLSKRTSIDRSQHDILQRIYSKRRSGASEANLVVAKSWADVVKLGAKQTQAKAVKHGPQRQLSKRPRKANTPKKPVSGVHSEFSTGHANSPCTIIIGKAHLEKVNVPARPYRMLNNFVINKKVDFNEDLSGLTEMFQTPAAKVKPQTMSLRPSALSEDVVRKEFQVPDPGEKPLLCTSETFGENVFPVTQNGPQEPSDKSLVSPVLRRQSVRVNVNIEKTPGSGAPKATSSANRLRRSVGPRSIQMPGAGRKDEEAKMDTVENVPGRLLRKTPQREQKLEGAAKEQESYFEASENDTEPKENSEEVVAVRRSRRYSEQNQEPAADLTPLKTWQDTEPKEDLGGIQGLLRMPIRVQEPKEAENKTAEKRQKSSKLELAGMPAAMSVQLETPLQKVDLEEEPLALGKPIQMPGGSTHSHGEPAGGDRNSGLFNRTPEQKLSPAEKLPASKRRPRTPKKKNHSLEDLAGLRELFQTPSHTDKPMAGDQTTKAPCQSPLAGPGNMPASKKRRLETPPQKVGLEEEPPALGKSTQMPGESPHEHTESGGGDKDIKLFNKTPEQKLKPADNVTGSKRRPRTPQKKVQSLEDLVGLKELFQTPEQTKKTTAVVKTTIVPCKSPLAETVNIPTHMKTRLKVALGKVTVENELSAVTKPTQRPEEATRTHREPVGEDEDIRLFKKTPKQTLKPEEDVTGSKRQPRTPKKKVQSLEDLVGLKELFQTPDPGTGDQTTKVPSKSPRAEPVNTPASGKRWLETPPQKVDLEEEPSALRKPTRMPGESPHEHREPGGKEEDINLFKETPKQELDPAENVTGSKKQPRTPRRNIQSLEDLVGLKELFQTPNHTDKPMTGDQTTKAPCQSPLAGPGNKPTNRRRRLKTPPQKVDLEEEPSALRKPTQLPGESPHEHGEPVGGDADIGLFKDTPKPKLEPVRNVSRSKRRPRTPKKKIQSSEDLAGLKELFQTTDPVTGDRTTKAPFQSPLAGPGNKPTNRRRRLKTPPQKADLKEEPSALRKPTQTPEESTHSLRESGGDDKDVKLFNRTAKQKLGPTENVTGRKNRPRAPNPTQPLEDLASFRESFPRPDHTKQRGDAGGIQGAPKQTPDGGKPVKPLARVRRAPRGKPVEDLAGHRDPAKSRSESSVSPSPKRKRGNEGGGPGTKRLRSVTPAQATAEEKPPLKKRRGAPREGRDPPEPLTAKRKLRIVAERMEVPEDLTGGERESRTEGREVGRTTASPQQAMSLRSRRPNKTKLEEQRPEPVKAAAEKVKTDRNDKKPRKTSQQTKPQSPEGRAKSSPPAGRVLASRMCLRSTRPRKVPLPDVAEEKQREKGVGVHVKNQEEEVTPRSDVMSLRSRKVKIPPGGNALESESQQRVTRSAKRCAGNIKRDEFNACIKRIRTRSRRDNEDV
ncbi:proliferation marker protein Ki-67 isoform X2 [Herpailurus yagouaroundi]|uniref:proliferation marker protein Ki-67 isoform X2 n=1 Tax=Herpailurus yagouaroundi TaxID=1608482 RepID=UPI001AD715D5|nr:proliferation marker protein Ki-67 isoform X2 [Puma yagouaroundi]